MNGQTMPAGPTGRTPYLPASIRVPAVRGSRYVPATANGQADAEGAVFGYFGLRSI